MNSGHQCIDCFREKQREYRNRPDIRALEYERRKEWQHNNPEKLAGYKQKYLNTDDNRANTNLKAREWRLKNKEYLAAKTKAYYAENKERIQAHRRVYIVGYNAKPKTKYNRLLRSAATRDIPVTISLEQYTALIGDNNPCYYCNGALDTDVGTGHRLDRIDNNRGYEDDNVVICCSFCNKIKQDLLSQEETIAAIAIIVAMRKNE
jgi:hypothetical protein